MPRTCFPRQLLTIGDWAELGSKLCGALAASLGPNQYHHLIGGGGGGVWDSFGDEHLVWQRG